MKLHSLLLLTTASMLFASIADEVRTADGFVLKGTVLSMDSEKLILQTGPFGELTVARDTITGLTLDQATSVRLEDESVWIGTVSTPETGTAQISGTRGSVSTEIGQIDTLWPAGTEDPRITARHAEMEKNRRKWSVDLAASADGKSGNTEEKNFSGSVEAVLAGPDDELKLYSRYSRSSSDGTKTADETIGGARFSSYVRDPLGWYIRTELERDEFENIQLRTTVAGGLSYRWANEPDYKLSGRTGLSYRHESYDNGADDEANIGLDFGLSHFYRFKNRWELKNELTFTPSIEDFKDYIATQDSHLSIPVSNSEWWKIRLGLRNDYNNLPGAGREHLDSLWYAALAATRNE
jgi:hypothetical protein